MAPKQISFDDKARSAILNGVKERYERFHGVRFTDGAVQAAVYQSHRYITDRFLPDKAIDVMDEVGPGGPDLHPAGGEGLPSRGREPDRLVGRLARYAVRRVGVIRVDDDLVIADAAAEPDQIENLERARPVPVPEAESEAGKIEAAASIDPKSLPPHLRRCRCRRR